MQTLSKKINNYTKMNNNIFSVQNHLKNKITDT